LAKFAPGVWDPEQDVWNCTTRWRTSLRQTPGARVPERLNELKALFWEEAEKYNATPLLGGMASFFGVLPPGAGKTTKFTFYSAWRT